MNRKDNYIKILLLMISSNNKIESILINYYVYYHKSINIPYHINVTISN